MEKYITDDELDQIWADNFDLDDVTEEDTKIIYREFLCDTKNRLKATLTDEQKKIFAFLEDNIEVYETSAMKDSFCFGYRLCMKRFLEEHCF